MESLWKKNITIPPREMLTKSIHTKAIVIGAGMAGILTAYLLQEQGIETVVLEANRIASGQTITTGSPIAAAHFM